jgi:predicted ATPase|tara:strand:+ start:68 stop:340 length:273 start_codon:yes stop_codon:yes gene_type:complete
MNAKKATKSTVKTVTVREAYEQIGALVLAAHKAAVATKHLTEFELDQLAKTGERFVSKGERLERQARVSEESRAAKLAKIAKLQAEIDAE